VSTIAAPVSSDIPAVSVDADPVRELGALLADVRERTLDLIAPVSEEDLRAQHDPLMSPIVWDLGHVAGFEELWLVRHLERPFTGVATLGEMPGIFNPFEHPRGERGALALPSIATCHRVLADVRERVLARLARVDFDRPSPLTRDGYVYRMVAQHEAQHGETILQTLQLKGGTPHSPAHRLPPPAAAAATAPGAMVRFPGGVVSIGTDDRRSAYDNERPRHAVPVTPFDIDVTPVTNGAYLEFMADGGYDTGGWWSDAGRAWLAEARVAAPKYWVRQDGGWWTRTMDRVGPVDRAHPVVHVCYHEAEAFARWAGKRLPTEREWEAAATWDPATGDTRLYPWGDAAPTPALANVGQLSLGTAAVGAYARNVSPVGCMGMIGDVWEWTASDFGAYPGFASFPYTEYSEPFFGAEYKVLRGGSWATHPIVARSTFRNWDYPIRRQIFSGFRCVRDV
jgi:gamma-glutamyl hercynylcysteine S-oxide synthase